MTTLKLITAFASLFSFGVAVAGPSDPVSLGMQLAQIDYEAVHVVLVERCKLNSPSTVPALVAAIENWKSKNDPALQQLRFLSKNNLVKKLGLSELDASAQLARTSEFLTAGLKGQFEHVPDSELKAACSGQYAAQTLGSPELDFNALLVKIQAANGSP